MPDGDFKSYLSHSIRVLSATAKATATRYSAKCPRSVLPNTDEYAHCQYSWIVDTVLPLLSTIHYCPVFLSSSKTLLSVISSCIIDFSCCIAVSDYKTFPISPWGQFHVFIGHPYPSSPTESWQDENHRCRKSLPSGDFSSIPRKSPPRREQVPWRRGTWLSHTLWHRPSSFCQLLAMNTWPTSMSQAFSIEFS